MKQRHARRGGGADRVLEILVPEVVAQIAREIVADEVGREREEGTAAKGLAAGVVERGIEGTRRDEHGKRRDRLGQAPRG